MATRAKLVPLVFFLGAVQAVHCGSKGTTGSPPGAGGNKPAGSSGESSGGAGASSGSAGSSGSPGSSGATDDGGGSASGDGSAGQGTGPAPGTDGGVALDTTPGRWHVGPDAQSGHFVFYNPSGQKAVLRGISMTGFETGTRET